MISHPIENGERVIVLLEFEIKWLKLGIVAANFAIGETSPVYGSARICGHLSLRIRQVLVRSRDRYWSLFQTAGARTKVQPDDREVRVLTLWR